MKKIKIIKTCRTVHSWLGIALFPWVVIIGITGVYLNHYKALYPLIVQEEFLEGDFTGQALTYDMALQQIKDIALKDWPNQKIFKIWREPYHQKMSIYAKMTSGLLILSLPTGHYYHKTRYIRETFAPDGELLHTKYYFGAIFKDFHRSGWLGGKLGTWIADIVGTIMVVFGITGLIVWASPKVKKWRNRKLKV